MSTAYIRGGLDTYVRESKPNKNFTNDGALYLSGNDGAGDRIQILMKIKSPVPAGATVVSAQLLIRQGLAVGGSRDLDVRPITSDVNFGNVTWANRPADSGVLVSTHKAAGEATQGAQWYFDVTSYYQAVANGAPNFGFKIAQDQDGVTSFYSSVNPDNDMRPLLIVTYSDAPSKPTKLKPNGTAVSLARPVVQCDYTDRSGATQLASVQVQVSGIGSFAPGDYWDSDEVPVNQPALDLAATDFPGATAGQTMWWRIRVKDSDNMWSEWSDVAWWLSVAKGELTITNPDEAPDNYVTEFTPPILWSFGATQTHYLVQVLSGDGTALLYDSGKVASAVGAHTLPAGVLVVDGATYIVRVFVWDNFVREATQGDPSYVQADRTFTVNYDPSVDPPDTINASQFQTTPFVLLEWTRDDAPDSWTILRDDGGGENVIAANVSPAATLQVDEVHRWTDWSIRPATSHTYRIRSEVNGILSDGGPTDTVVTAPEGIWLVDMSTLEWVVLGGKDVTVASPDNAQTYSVLGSLDVVRSVMGLSGLSGACDKLMLRSRNGHDWSDYERLMYSFKQRPASQFRLIFGDLNIPVIIGNVTLAPHPQTQGGQVLKTVSFDWWQTSEHPFSGNL